jgi:N-acetylglutamate synthase-like GNAT family acetyltransferase
MPSNAFPRQAQGLTFSIIQTLAVTPAFQGGGYSQRVVDASENDI